jgi:hypothetical protein
MLLKAVAALLLEPFPWPSAMKDFWGGGRCARDLSPYLVGCAVEAAHLGR